MTYAELDRAVGGAADRLTSAGVGPGRVVAVALPSHPDLVISVLAALACDARVALLNSRWWPRDLRATLEGAQPDLVVTTAALRVALGDHAPVAVLGDHGSHASWSDPSSVDLPRADVNPSGGGVGTGGPRRAVPGGADGGGGSLVCYTNGAWHDPRPVAFRPTDLVDRWAARTGTGATTTLVAGGAATAAGLEVVIGSLSAGGTVLLTEHDGPGRLARRLAQGGIDRLWASGPQLNLLAARLSGGSALAGVDVVEAAAGTLHQPAARRLAAALGARIATSFTLAEAGGAVAGREPGPAETHRPLDVGHPFDGWTVDVMDGNGAPVAAGEVGAVVVGRAPAGRRDGRAGGGTAERVMTGDLARRDGTGALHLQGRAAERFDSDGDTVWPALIEAALGAHPGLVDVAIAPRPHAGGGSVPVAVTVPLDPERPPFLSDLAPYLDALPDAWRPRAQAVVDRLPLTASGQLHRRMLAYDEAAR
jgi:acyl-coenzyme A synthetase/AMP-(fatty) acid ligase